MKDMEIVNLINRTEADLWSVFAQHHEVDGHCLVYDVQSPTHLWSNSVYAREAGHRFELYNASLLETFYQVHGLEGFLRDFHGDFKTKSIATYTYFYFDPRSTTALASPPTLQMHRCPAGELGAFSEAARIAYARGPDFLFSVYQRMTRVLNRYPGTLLTFHKDGSPAAVVSLIHLGGVSRLVHFAVRPDLRGNGYGVEILQSALRSGHGPVVGATEVPGLVSRTFPAAGFRAISRFDVIPLYSLLR